MKLSQVAFQFYVIRVWKNDVAFMTFFLIWEIQTNILIIHEGQQWNFDAPV